MGKELIKLSNEERFLIFKIMYPNSSVNDFRGGGMEVQSLNHQLDNRFEKALIPKYKIKINDN